MSLPTLLIAPTTSSNGIILEIPARAMSAANTAFAAPIALRFIQGHSTSPATGSHTSPSMFLTAIAAALNEAAGDAPQSSASAAAAIADAEPISAWHPPSAPEMLALRAIITPTAPAANKPLTRSLSVNPCFSLHITSTAGSTPLAPAVGAATIRPIEAFTSATARAAAQICAMSLPIFAFSA